MSTLLRPTPVSTLLAVALIGCATPGPPAPVVSPTGVVYDLGTPPRETRWSQTAALYLGRERLDEALAQAQAGIAADSTNPVHYFVAGQAHVALGDLEAADLMWREAQRLYPAYELDIEPAREAAWAETFNDGVELYLAGNVEGAIVAWETAALVYDLRSDVHENLGVLLAEVGDHERAVEIYRLGLAGLDRVPATHVLEPFEIAEREQARAGMEGNLAQLLLVQGDYAEAEILLRRRLQDDPESVELAVNLGVAVSALGRDDEAARIYSSLLDARSLTTYQLTQIGTSLFHAGDFVGAATAFERVTAREPDGRDGWFNFANALLAEDAWESLVGVGDRLIALDPLSESSALISARSHIEMGNEPAARAALERLEGLPVLLDELQLWRAEDDTRVRGTVVGHAAESGTNLRLRFVFYSGDREVGDREIAIAAPAADVRESFSVAFAGVATAYRYELIPEDPILSDGDADARAAEPSVSTPDAALLNEPLPLSPGSTARPASAGLVPGP